MPYLNLTPDDVNALVDAFEKKYEELYGEGAAFRGAGLEITTFRVNGEGRLPKPQLKEYAVVSNDPSPALLRHRKVYFYELQDFSSTAIYQGSLVQAGNKIPGPAIIEYPGTTVVIRPTQTGKIDTFLIVKIEESRA